MAKHEIQVQVVFTLNVEVEWEEGLDPEEDGPSRGMLCRAESEALGRVRAAGFKCNNADAL